MGEVAIELLGTGAGTYIEYEGGSLAGALDVTRRLMASEKREPIYEATLQHEGVLIREDVLLPVDGANWRIIEVKASTKLKNEHVEDCAIQAWVHQGSGYPLKSISLAHINNQFVYEGNGNYRGLLDEVDLTDQVRVMQTSVPVWVERAMEAVNGKVPIVPVGHQCGKPYPCPFINHCWPSDTRYPVQGLGGGKKKLGEWVAKGYRDVRDVPSFEITSANRLLIHQVTLSEQPQLLEGARRFVEELEFPRFYLDFETVGPAIPIWKGTRPYQALPYQWSCHIERAPGTIEHREFLDLSGEPPMRALAEALILDLESKGPVLMYTGFELGVINTLIGLYPDLEEPLRAIIDRLVDLHPAVKKNYYHPNMLGSWSIKAVLPTIAPEMDYNHLEGIKEGMGASEAYLEAINPGTSMERKAEIEAELLKYCKHDTEAMVVLTHFLGGV